MISGNLESSGGFPGWGSCPKHIFLRLFSLFQKKEEECMMFHGDLGK
jgi:hypothetical protein